MRRRRTAFRSCPTGIFTTFPADRREKNCKIGLWPRVAVAAEIAKATDFMHSPIRYATPLVTALQQSRSTRSEETPAFAYTYCTNQLLNGFMRRLSRVGSRLTFSRAATNRRTRCKSGSDGTGKPPRSARRSRTRCRRSGGSFLVRKKTGMCLPLYPYRRM